MRFTFTQLSVLHNNMINNGEFRAKFSFSYNNRNFTCVFLCDIVPYRLIIAYLGQNLAIEMIIDNDYSTPSYLDNILYKRLINLLGIRFDPNHKFTPTTFFEIINNHIPNYCSLPNYFDVLIAERYCRNIEEADKIYFCGFRANPLTQNVSTKNYEKTLIAFGTDIANTLKKHNLSTRWTHIKNEENIKMLTDYLDKIDH